MNENKDPLEPLVRTGLVDRSRLVSARATYYPEKIKVFVPFHPYAKGLEQKTTNITKTGVSTEENIERSVNRSKSTVHDYVLCNKFDLFCTFTFRDDRQDIDKCKTKMNNWLKNQKKRNGKFSYLIVPEFHKDEKAIHFHSLFKNYKGKLRSAINPKTNKPLKKGGKQVYDLPGYTLGFSNARHISNTPEDHERISNYIRKYITKDMLMFQNKNRFWASHDLRKPIYEENPTWYTDKQPYWSKIVEHGTVHLYERDAGIIPQDMWD